MIKEKGRVIEIDGAYVLVETSIKSTCSSCAAKSNCGTSAIASAVAGKTVVNKVTNQLDADLGDVVEIGIPEETLLGGAFWVYLFPLFSALSFVFVANLWLSKFIPISEPALILVTLAGGVAGFLYSRQRLARSGNESLEPVLLNIVMRQPAEIDIRKIE